MMGDKLSSHAVRKSPKTRAAEVGNVNVQQGLRALTAAALVAFVMLLASGYSVVNPCHVAPAEMRQHPIGTGPFRFVEFKPNERITLTRNLDYWKSGHPYLDGVEFTIIRDVSTANLAFIAGKTDWIATTIPLIRDITSQAFAAICEVTPGGISRNLLINRDRPPFNAAGGGAEH